MKAQRIHLIAVVLLGTALAGCRSRDEPLPQDVLTALQSHYNSSDTKGAAELFTDDGAIMQEFAPPVRGKAAIVEFLQDDLRKQLQYWISSEGSMSSGDLAYDQGSYRVRDINKVRDLESGKYVIIYKRVNGQWKIFRNIYNTDSLKICDAVVESSAPNCSDAAKPEQK